MLYIRSSELIHPFFNFIVDTDTDVPIVAPPPLLTPTPFPLAMGTVSGHLWEWPPSINQQTTSAGGDMEKGEPLGTVGGNAAGTVTVETNAECPQNGTAC